MPDGVWQQTQGSGFLPSSAVNAHSGNNAYAPNGDGGSNATVQQVLNTMIGQAYDLSFYYVYDSNGPITVSFGGLAVAFTSTPSTKGYDLGTATDPLATATSTALDFSSIGGDTFLDDVSVTASVITAAVPEPASLALLTAGLLGLAVQRRLPVRPLRPHKGRQ